MSRLKVTEGEAPMKPDLKSICAGLAAALLSLAASAQVENCGKARDPQRCEALQKAKEACKDKSAADKRKCMMEAMPPMDCSKARNPQRCEATQKAKEACKEKPAAEFRQCMREQMPKGRR
jgi:hypothetical protein